MDTLIVATVIIAVLAAASIRSPLIREILRETFLHPRERSVITPTGHRQVVVHRGTAATRRGNGRVDEPTA
jgi:hypothetical protein